MTWTLPTIAETLTRARRAFRAELKGSDAAIWPNNLYVTAKVIAGVMKGLFDRLDIVRKDIFAHTAGLDGVQRHATEFGLARRPAVPAAGAVTITTSGPAAILKGARLTRADGAVIVVTQARRTVGTETFDLPVYAETAGTAGNTEAETELEPGDGFTGAIETAVVAAPGLVGGAEPEDIDTSLRARVLFRKRNPIHGGAPADYVTWASTVPGVTRVFVARRPYGRGTVGVYPLMDDNRADGLPLPADITRIREAVEIEAPSDAEVFVVPARRFPIDVTLTRLVPDTAAVRTAIRTELLDLFVRRGRVAGADPGHPALPFLTTPHTFDGSWIGEAISQAAGESGHRLAPLEDVVVPSYHLPVLGTLTFPEVSQ